VCLAPILLILNQDNYIFRKLEEKNRYFPVFASMTLLLGFATLGQTVLRFITVRVLGYILLSTEFPWYKQFYNVVLFLLSLPSNYFFNIYLLDFVKQNISLWLLIAPLNVLPLFFADYLTIQLLGALGIVGGIYHYFSIPDKVEKNVDPANK